MAQKKILIALKNKNDFIKHLITEKGKSEEYLKSIIRSKMNEIFNLNSLIDELKATNEQLQKEQDDKKKILEAELNELQNMNVKFEKKGDFILINS
jgi:flagellar biosynthesis chaperone FliJ